MTRSRPNPNRCRRRAASSPLSPLRPRPRRRPLLRHRHACPQSRNQMAPHRRRSRELHQRQVAILRSALAQVAPGGRLIYSTCSLEKEENENVVEQALSENNSFRLLDCRPELDRLKASGRTNLARPRLAHPRPVPSHNPWHPPLRRLLRRNPGKNLKALSLYSWSIRVNPWLAFYRTSKFTALSRKHLLSRRRRLRHNDARGRRLRGRRWLFQWRVR